jgi:uncharacterized protein (TIRG00374 family)
VKLAINITLSLVMLAVCVWLVWPNAHDRHELDAALRGLELASFWPYLLGYVLLLATTHFFRAYRWNNLLRPIGAELPTGKLLAISSVGFMAILALPARLGELARPALLRDRGKVSGAAVLGTVAVERIVDGLIVSVLVFACCFSLRGPSAPGWMMPMAWTSLGIFVAAMTFLGLALRNPDRTIRVCVSLSGARLVSPKLAARLEDMLRKLISGFLVLKDRRNLALFALWSAVYWVANGMGMWVLARGMGLDISPIGALATMGIVAVGITLPNSPGLVGQFHWFTTLGLSLYLPSEVAQTRGLAYAILLHGIQVVWYVGIGALAMLTSHVSWAEVLRRRVDEPVPQEGKAA